MKAAILREVNKPLTIEEVQIDRPGPHEVLIRTGACGVCHSDLHFIEGKYPCAMPTILGHEAAGTVEAVGELVEYVQLGDRVITCLSGFCGHCAFCLSGRPALCSQAGIRRGATEAPRLSQDGKLMNQVFSLAAFAEQMLVHEHSLVKVGTEVSFEQLALIGCGVTTGVGAALNTAEVLPGSTVAVLGCGGVGTAVIQGARIAGASRIIAVDGQPLKREQAKKFGATDVVDPANGDPVQQVKDLTQGRGADYAFEVVGLPETMITTYNMARKGGTVCIVGMARADAMVTFPAFQLFFEEKRILGSKYGTAHVRRDFQRFVDLIETGRLDVSHMVSRKIKLDQVNEAFRAMEAGEVIRSVIMPG